MQPPRLTDLSELLDLLQGLSATSHRARSLYAEAADHICLEWLRRSKKCDLPPPDTATGYLKRAAYLLIRTFLERDLGRVIVGQVEKDGRVPARGPTFAQNPFHWGLLAMFVDDSIIDKDERRLFANQLLYAHRHDVPEHFLIGFIYQQGKSQKIFERVRAGHLEPWVLKSNRA